MQYSSCLNPQLVYNKFLKTYIQVPCRKCEACRLLSTRKYVERLKAERERWQDSLFFTLTYAPEFMPQVEFTDNFVVAPSEKVSIKKHLNYARIADYYNEDIWFTDRVNEKFGFGVVSQRDIINFLKILRDRFSKSSCFVAAEYGPTTFRPHYHGLIFFNPRGIEREVQVDYVSSVITDLWSVRFVRGFSTKLDRLVQRSIGFVQIRYDMQSSATYTAQYTNSLTNLPTILQNCFPPFTKSYGIGEAFEFSDFSLHELLYAGFVRTFPSYVSKYGVKYFDEFVCVPFEFLTKIFPKFRGSNRISSEFFYTLLYAVYTLSDFEKFITQIRFQPNDALSLAISELFDEAIIFITDSQLKSFYYALRSCLKVCVKYNLTFEQYVYNYQKAWSGYELFKLKEFYELQQQIADDKLIDSRWINGLYLLDNVSVNLPFPDAPLEFCHLSLSNPLFAKYSHLMKKICLDTTKTKKRNDYLRKL